MLKRADPRQLEKLVVVQLVRRAAAEVALVAARDGELQAQLREATARAEASAAQDDWFLFLDRPGFAPDYARGLAARLVQREAVADQARKDRRVAADAHLDRQDDWRLSEAHAKLTEASFDRARRDAGRMREEKRINALADRVTYAWVQT